jgi:hypothetical protein
MQIKKPLNVLHYVYELIDPRNGIVFYVGKGKNNRYLKHLYEAKRTTIQTKRLNKIRSILKSGYSSYNHKIIFSSYDETLVFQKEIEIISKYGIENLCNLTEGGTGGDTFSMKTKKQKEQYKKNCSKAQKGIKTSEEEKEKHRKIWRDKYANGYINPKKGKTYLEMYGIKGVEEINRKKLATRKRNKLTT